MAMSAPPVGGRRIWLMTWNIDGLDGRDITERTLAVCDVITKEEPDVVFLQEVVPSSEKIIQAHCQGYTVIPSGDGRYYTAILLRKKTTTPPSDVKILPFPSTQMARNLLSAKTNVGGAEVQLMTSHLESTKDCAFERKKQLRMCFEKMKAASPTVNVVFGGDLNIRDKELLQVGGPPKGIVDVWKATGAAKDTEFTWDVSKNDNLDWPFANKPKIRFDRLYMRPATSPGKKMSAFNFRFVGKERLPESRRFPSDHWGLMTCYDVTE